MRKKKTAATQKGFTAASLYHKKVLGRLQIAGGCLAALIDQIVGNFLPFLQIGHARFFHSGNMHKHVFAAVIGL